LVTSALDLIKKISPACDIRRLKICPIVFENLHKIPALSKNFPTVIILKNFKGAVILPIEYKNILVNSFGNFRTRFNQKKFPRVRYSPIKNLPNRF